MSSATFFSWLQRAPFYRAAHEAAVATLPSGRGRWVDVGTGPGLVARAAAARGYVVHGFDADEAMIAVAKRDHGAATFSVASLNQVEQLTAPAQVVSAASLVTVLDEPKQALDTLWRLVAPAGTLLIIETTAQMRLPRALALGHSQLGLLLWATVRGGRTVAPLLDAFEPDDLAARTFHPVLHGLLGAWAWHRRLNSPAVLKEPS